jgi:hypothetical protein
MSLLAAVAQISFAAVEGEEEPSKTLFYAVGGALAVWAVVVGGLGTLRPDAIRTRAAAMATMAISIVLVAGTLAASIVTS